MVTVVTLMALPLPPDDVERSEDVLRTSVVVLLLPLLLLFPLLLLLVAEVTEVVR